jgi:hypothetical protein
MLGTAQTTVTANSGKDNLEPGEKPN